MRHPTSPPRVQKKLIKQVSYTFSSSFKTTQSKFHFSACLSPDTLPAEKPLVAEQPLGVEKPTWAYKEAELSAKSRGESNTQALGLIQP
jgi:hypothetical protein